MSNHVPLRATLYPWSMSIAVLLLIFPALTVQAGRSSKAVADALATRLYVAGERSQQPMVALDPATLADAEAVPPLDLGDATGGWWLLSDDGATFVVAEFGARQLDAPAGQGYQVLTEADLVVRDGPTGPERARIASSFLYGMWLSRDGSRLIVESAPELDAMDPELGQQVEWSVFDTTNGERLNTLHVEAATDWSNVLVDTERSRLYRLFTRERRASVGPSAVTLVAHDLLARADDGELGRLALPDVLAGTWLTCDIAPDGEYPIGGYLAPGTALSPDGRWLAVAHADAEALTLIDTASLTIERSGSLARPAGVVDRLLTFLSFAPQSAAAKFARGTTRWAVFAPDGDRLYVWGTEAGMDDDQLVVDEFDLWAVDPERGTIVAEHSPPGQVFDVLPAPDGRTIYLSSADERQASDQGVVSGTVLRRLDARTLATEAERTFADAPWLRLVLRPSAG